MSLCSGGMDFKRAMAWSCQYIEYFRGCLASCLRPRGDKLLPALLNFFVISYTIVGFGDGDFLFTTSMIPMLELTELNSRIRMLLGGLFIISTNRLVSIYCFILRSACSLSLACYSNLYSTSAISLNILSLLTFVFWLIISNREVF